MKNVSNDHKRLETNEKTLRLYAFISQVNQNIVHVKDEESLFRNACTLALEFGKFNMAWIGLFNTEKSITLIEQSGIPDDQLTLFKSAPYQEGGPQDYVLKNNGAFFCNNIEDSLKLKSWKPFARKNNVNSCLVLPIRKSGVIIGSFNLYSEKLIFSDQEEINLLLQLSDDISFALDTFEKTKKHELAEALLLKNEKRFHHTLDNMIEGIQIHDFNYKYVYVNDALVSYSTYKREELLGHTLMEKYPGIEQTPLFASIKRCLEERVGELLETEFVFPNGTKADFELSIQPIPEGVSILSIDRTEQKKAKEKLEKVNRLYAFLSAINQSIVHTTEESVFLDNVCKIALGTGGFKIGWIDLIDEQDGRLHMVAICGEEQIKEKAKAYSGQDPNHPFLQNTPTGRALSTGMYAVSNDVQNDPSMVHWREELVSNEIKAIISLPIKKSGKIIGVFALYSVKENFFDEDEINLLTEAAGDISFALENFEKNKKHKLTEQLVLHNEKRFRALIEKSTDMKTLSNKEGLFLYGSPSVTKVFGYTPDEFLNMPAINFFHPSDIPEFALKRADVLKNPGKSFNFRYRLLHKNNTWIWCEGTFTNLLDEPGINAMVSNFIDITDKKLIEDQREFDTNNFNALINNTADLMWSVDKDFNLITSNEPFDQMAVLNFGKVILKGENILLSAYTPEMLDHFKKIYNRAFAGEEFTEISHFTIPFEFWSEISYYPIRKGHEIIGTACHSRDITERKLAERKLLQSEIFNRGVLDSLTSHIAVVDRSGTIVAANGSWNRFSLANGETDLQQTGEGSNYFDVCEKSAEAGDNIAALVLKGLTDVLNEKETVFDLEYPCHSPDEQRWFGLRAIRFEGDEPMVVVAHQDITDRNLAREALLKSESNFRTIFENTTSGFLLLDKQFNILSFNKQASHFAIHAFGVNLLPNANFLDLLSPERKDDFNMLLQSILKGDSVEQDVNYPSATGTIEWYHSTSTGVTDENGEAIGICLTVDSITERKKAEADLENRNKELVKTNSELDRFVYSVSHDLRAPLSSMLGIIDISLDITKEKIIQDHFKMLQGNVRKLDGFIGDILAYSRNSRIGINLEVIDFKTLLEEITQNLKFMGAANRMADIRIKIIDKIPCYSDKSRLSIILNNLISNAIRYQNPEISDPFVEIKIETFPDKTEITIHDNGIGIRKELHEKIFDMFFRVSEASIGSGLGLYIVKEAVNKLGGTITLDSEPFEGCTFKINIPAN